MYKKSICGVFIAVILILSLVHAASLKAAEVNVQYIAVHFGNAEHSNVMDKTEFPKFQFYTAPGEVYGYTEEQKLVGNPTNLTGWYGEVPEKMGFCANYTVEKYYSRPYRNGVIYLIDSEGVISYQLTSKDYNPEGYADLWDGIYSEIRSKVKKLEKGKGGAKALSKEKSKYLKNSPIGELEPTKGSKIDKKEDYLVGWAVPDLEVVDESGNKTSLQEVTKGKVTVLVFYTLNGTHWKQGDKKGNIIKEWDGGLLINTKTFNERSEERFMDDAQDKTAGKAVGKLIVKGILKSKGGLFGLAGDLMSSKEELSDEEKAGAYRQAISLLEFARDACKGLD